MKVEGVVAAFSARLDAIDKATGVFEANLTRVPTALQEALGHLKALHEVKFEGVQTQLAERDSRVEATARDTKIAVDAALSAAEKATSKQAESFSEAADKAGAAFTKAIDQQAALYQTETRALRDICNMLDRRLTVIEGQATGHQGAKTEGQMSAGFIVSMIAVGVAILAVLLPYLAQHH